MGMVLNDQCIVYHCKIHETRNSLSPLSLPFSKITVFLDLLSILVSIQSFWKKTTQKTDSDICFYYVTFKFTKSQFLLLHIFLPSRGFCWVTFLSHFSVECYFATSDSCFCQVIHVNWFQVHSFAKSSMSVGFKYIVLPSHPCQLVSST